MSETLGQKIKRLREAKGLSQSALARELGVKPQAVQKWEGTGVPRTQRLEAIAAALDVSSAELMGSQPTESPEKWPFKSVTAGQLASLSRPQLKAIETTILELISAFSGRPRKQEEVPTTTVITRLAKNSDKEHDATKDRGTTDGRESGKWGMRQKRTTTSHE